MEAPKERIKQAVEQAYEELRGDGVSSHETSSIIASWVSDELGLMRAADEGAPAAAGVAPRWTVPVSFDYEPLEMARVKLGDQVGKAVRVVKNGQRVTIEFEMDEPADG